MNAVVHTLHSVSWNYGKLVMPLNPSSWESMLAGWACMSITLCHRRPGKFQGGVQLGSSSYDQPLRTCNLQPLCNKPSSLSTSQRSFPRFACWVPMLSHGSHISMSTNTARHLHVNRFSLIPKSHNTRNYRLITDLSFSQV